MRAVIHIKLKTFISVLFVCLLPVIFFGCIEPPGEWKDLAYGYRVQGSGTNVNIDYIDEDGNAATATGVDLSVDWWEMVSNAPFGAVRSVGADDLSAGTLFITFWGDDGQVANAGGSTSAWIKYTMPYTRPLCRRQTSPLPTLSPTHQSSRWFGGCM